MSTYRVTLTLDFDVEDKFALTDAAFQDVRHVGEGAGTTGRAHIGDSEILMHIADDQGPAALNVLVGQWVAAHPPMLPGASAEVGVDIHTEARPDPA
jgi:hypothetical protein